MSNPEIKKYRDFSDWFLKMFAIQVLVLSQDNWSTLSDDAKNEGTMPVLAGLTHKDYVDGPVLWSALTDEEILLQIVVMREGFNGGMKGLRNIISNQVAPSLQLSRNGTGAEELKAIQASGEKNSAVGLFLSGNRKLTSPLKGGITSLMRSGDVMYPFVNLSDHSPIFLSESTLTQNAKQLIDRAILDRAASREFLYLLKPLTRDNIDELAEGKKSKAGREEILEKLEIIRAYGVLKTFIEVAKFGYPGANPLLQNPDNLPLLVKSKQKLMSNLDKVGWFLNRGYFAETDLRLMFAIALD